MSKSITQDMAYRQSLMKYAEKYGVSRASRKYNKSRSYIYFWKARWDGSVESLACQSRRPHSHPNQHTEAELKLIRDMRRRNPDLGLLELWSRLKKRGYTRRPESLFRVMRKLGMFPRKEKKKAHVSKPYQQMTYPGQRVHRYGSRNFWCRGYYVDTVEKNVKMIQEYIKNQLEDDYTKDQISIKEYVDPFTGSRKK